MARLVRNAGKIALFALLCTIWGSTWIVIKEGYGGLGPFNVAGVRFLIAALIFAALVPLLHVRWPRGRKEWLLVLWVGSVLFALDYGLIYWGELSIDSGLTAVLFATLPLTTALFAHLYVPGERLTVRTLGGTLLAFAGVIALFADNLRIDPAKALPMLAILASAVCAAAAGVATKRHGRDLHPAALNAPAMLVGALLLFAASLATGDGLALPRDMQTWSAVLYLAIAGSVVTFFIYFTLLKSWSTTTMSFIAVFTPLIALALGFFVRGELMTPWAGLGAALILGGVGLAVTKGALRARAPRVRISDERE